MTEEKAKAEEKVKTDPGVEYTAHDGQPVKLTLAIVKKYLVHGHPELVSDQELMYFLHICRARGLNPFTKDAYLIKFTADQGAAIVTAIDFYRRRAKAAPDCKGWKKGILVKTTGGRIKATAGIMLEDEKLVGGWFEAQPQNWTEPFRLEVNLNGYIKKKKSGEITQFWQAENQPSQIAKVAESQGLRTLWPDLFTGTYTDAEINGAPIDTVGLITEGQGEGEEAADLFDSTVPEGTNLEHLMAFLETTAKIAKKTIDEVRAEGLKEKEKFWAAFSKWEAKKFPPAKEVPGEKSGMLYNKERKRWEPKKAEEVQGDKIECPDSGQMVEKSVCLECYFKPGCPAFD